MSQPLSLASPADGTPLISVHLNEMVPCLSLVRVFIGRIGMRHDTGASSQHKEGSPWAGERTREKKVRHSDEVTELQEISREFHGGKFNRIFYMPKLYVAGVVKCTECYLWPSFWP